MAAKKITESGSERKNDLSKQCGAVQCAWAVRYRSQRLTCRRLACLLALCCAGRGLGVDGSQADG